jgi:hypothetical protein
VVNKHELRVSAGRSYWREADARVIVEAWQQSGETGVAFARELGVHPRRLRWWASRLGRPQPTAVRFHPVRVASADTSQREVWIEMDLGNGPRVRVPPGFAAEDLRRVLAVLDEVSSC